MNGEDQSVNTPFLKKYLPHIIIVLLVAVISIAWFGNYIYKQLSPRSKAAEIVQTPPKSPASCNLEVPSSSESCTTNSFSDVTSGSPYYLGISCSNCRNVMNGYDDNTFRPSNDIVREAAAKVISNAVGFNDSIPSTTQTFADVPNTGSPSSDFWIYIERAAAHNVISGYPCGEENEPCDAQHRPYFRPYTGIARESFAKLVSEAAQYNDTIPTTRQTFHDVPYAGSPSSAFWVYIERLSLHNIITGYACGGNGEPCPGTYFRPYDNVFRGQAAKIVSSAFLLNCQHPGPK